MTETIKQLPKNITMNVLAFAIKLFLGLWITPYYVETLGVAAYGLIPLALVFSEYSNLLAQSFNVATVRFLSIEMQKEDHVGVSKVFSSSFVTVFLIFLAQTFVFVFFVFNLTKVVSLPDGYHADAVSLFLLTYVGFFFTMIGAIYGVSMYAKNRLDLIQINEIVKFSTMVVWVLILFSLFGAKLVYVGIANLLSGATVAILSIWRCKQLAPDMKFKFKYVEFRSLRPLFFMSIWVIINTIGALLYTRIDAYVVNRFIGAEASGEYSAVLQFNQLMRTATVVLSGVISPLCIIYYARGETEKLTQLLKVAVKVITIFIAVPLAALCAFSGSILHLWLGPEFETLWPLMVLQLMPLLINLGVYPLFSLNIAMNKVKVPAIVTCLLGVGNFILAMWFVKYTTLGVYGVAMAGAIMLTLKNAIFTPLYSSRILKISRWTFFNPLACGILYFLIFYTCFLLLDRNLNFNTFAVIAISLCIFSAFSYLLVLNLMVKGKERQALYEIFPNKLQFFIKKIVFANK